MDIYKDKKGENLIFSVPLKVERSNPYDEDEHDLMDNVVGVIMGEEIGFSYWIDRAYKDKDDDISVPFFQYFGDREEFIALCKKLDIYLYEYPLCVECKKPIFGSYTYNDKGEVCWDCNNKEN